MAKEMHVTTVKVLKFVQKFFRKGEILSYDRIGEGVRISRECARRHANILAKKRLLSIKGGHIVAVK